MGQRRMARELALQAMYAAELRGVQVPDIAAENIAWRKPSQEAREYAGLLARMVHEHSEECDRLIRENTEHWAFARIAVLDRIILRIGICELLYGDRVPSRVAINEAIELAKKYSTEKSGAFINGILDAVLKKRNGKFPQELADSSGGKSISA